MCSLVVGTLPKPKKRKARWIDTTWAGGCGMGPGSRIRHISRACPGDRLDATEAIASCILGLPMAPDLSDSQIARVVSALAEAVDR
jgi:hypothetical protein